MPGFAQIIEFTTSRFDEGQKLVDEYRAKTEGRRVTGRSMTLRDRENPNKYYVIVEFASYEDAMRNNDLPETGELAQGLEALTDGPTIFHNLDIEQIEEA